MLTYKINYIYDVVMIYKDKRFIGRIVNKIKSYSTGLICPDVRYRDVFYFYTGKRCNWNNPNTKSELKSMCPIGMLGRIEDKYGQEFLNDKSLLGHDGWFFKIRKPSDKKVKEEKLKFLHNAMYKLLLERRNKNGNERYTN